jgi:hypothetical protein
MTIRAILSVQQCRRLLEPFIAPRMIFVGAESSVSGLEARVVSTSLGDHSR